MYSYTKITIEVVSNGPAPYLTKVLDRVLRAEFEDTRYVRRIEQTDRVMSENEAGIAAIGLGYETYDLIGGDK